MADAAEDISGKPGGGIVGFDGDVVVVDGQTPQVEVQPRGGGAPVGTVVVVGDAVDVEEVYARFWEGSTPDLVANLGRELGEFGEERPDRGSAVRGWGG